MLLRFKTSNFRSIRNEQELSLIASPLQDAATGVSFPEGFDGGILKVAAIYGANASGKTNVLRALHFMGAAVVTSQTRWKPQQRIPRQHFRLDESSSNEPTTMEADLFLDGSRYQYGFSMDSDRILEEWCYAFPRGRRQLWFSRTLQTFRFGKHFAANRLIQEVTRENSLFLSAAAQNNHKQLLMLYTWFDDQLTVLTSNRQMLLPATLAACADSAKKGRIEHLLKAADLGLVGFDTVEEKHDEQVLRMMKAFFASAPDAPTDSGEAPDIPDRRTEIEFLHRSGDAAPVRFRSGAESDGTKTYFALLGPIVDALETGGTLCVDELDASLHPLLALELVRIFNSDETNALGAQLIFNTHDTNLLDPATLRRDQIWFTEKDESGATHLYPLTDFKSRKDDNLRRGYLQGRYGAIPFLGGSLPSVLNSGEANGK